MLEINFFIGKKTTPYFNEIFESHKVMSLLMEERTIEKNYKYIIYLKNSVFINFDKYFLKYNLFSNEQKFNFLYEYIISKNINDIYLLSNKINIELFELFLKHWEGDITINYLNEKDIENIKNINKNLKFNKIKEG